MFTSRSRTSYISRKRNKQAQAYLAQLLFLLRKHFDEEEFRVLCFELSVNFQDFPGSGRAAKMEEFLLLQAREGHVDSLVAVCREQRERVAWPERPESVSKTDLMLAATPEKPISKNRRHKLMLLERVNKIWIEGVFTNSVHHQAVIELNKHSLETAVAEDNSWQMVIAKPGDEPKQLPPDTHILDVFVEMDETLLVLGEPGAGKTTTLLQLANELIDQARINPDFPIPVIFSLSTWQGEPLFKWLATELNKKYKIPKEIARDWVAEDDLLLLLDGLDEVSLAQQEACIAAINDFRKEHGFTGMAVCSRAHEYEALTTRLQFNGAVVLEPLTEKQISDYLQKVDSGSIDLHQRLLNDTSLQELAKSPLMLSVMTVAYRGSGEDEHSSTVQDSREQLFDTYVEQMLVRGRSQSGFSSQQTIIWLNNLAQILCEQNKTAFFIEEIQPSWLPTKQQRNLHFLAVNLIVVLLFTFAACLYKILNNYIFNLNSGENLVDGFTQAGVVVLVAILVLFLARWLPIWLTIVIVAAFFIKLNQIYLPINSMVGILYGLAAGGTAAATTKKNKINIITFNYSWRKAFLGLFVAVLGFIGMLLIGEDRILSFLTYGLFLFGLMSMIPLGLIGHQEPLDEIIYPNQGVEKSIRNAIKVGSIILLITLIFGGFVGAVLVPMTDKPIEMSVANGVILSSLFGIALALILALFYGGTSYLQHIILRFQLSRAGIIPWNTIAFLDYTTRCVFLQQVGGGYIFIHRLFLEYFANLQLHEHKFLQKTN